MLALFSGSRLPVLCLLSAPRSSAQDQRRQNTYSPRYADCEIGIDPGHRMSLASDSDMIWPPVRGACARNGTGSYLPIEGSITEEILALTMSLRIHSSAEDCET